MSRYFLIVSLLLLGCASKEKNKANPQDSGLVKSVEIPARVEPTFIQKLANTENASEFIRSSEWRDYESSGDADTAIALFGYRVSKSKEQHFTEFEEYIRLYHEYVKIVDLTQAVFLKDTTLNAVFTSIQKINLEFKEYAINQVKQDSIKFGQSDGPYFEFVEGLKE